MWRHFTASLRYFDWILFVAVALLLCFGLVTLYSIGLGGENISLSNFNKQLIFAAIGLTALFVLSVINYRWWADAVHLGYAGVALLLILVLFFGSTISGTTGWFVLPGFSFQPVELAKISLIAFLAWFLSRYAGMMHQFKYFVLSALIVGGYFGLVILQPDFGSGIILCMLWFVLIIFGGANKKHLGILMALGLIVGVITWFFLFQDYQQARILTFFDPQADPYGRGYQVRQAITAVGAGGLFGRGLGFGSQSQLKFLPASQTDFIFAVIAEELGFLGVSVILLCWGVILYRLIRAARRMRDPFAAFFILGVSALFFVHIMINIGMNIGIVPVTGISLPFLSYGGSFLVTCLILIGMVESMIVRNRTA